MQNASIVHWTCVSMRKHHFPYIIIIIASCARRHKHNCESTIRILISMLTWTSPSPSPPHRHQHAHIKRCRIVVQCPATASFVCACYVSTHAEQMRCTRRWWIGMHFTFCTRCALAYKALETTSFSREPASVRPLDSLTLHDTWCSHFMIVEQIFWMDLLRHGTQHRTRTQRGERERTEWRRHCERRVCYGANSVGDATDEPGKNRNSSESEYASMHVCFKFDGNGSRCSREHVVRRCGLGVRNKSRRNNVRRRGVVFSWEKRGIRLHRRRPCIWNKGGNKGECVCATRCRRPIKVVFMKWISYLQCILLNTRCNHYGDMLQWSLYNLSALLNPVKTHTRLCLCPHE